MCSIGTHRHRLQCAQRCAQTRSKTHHSAANANQAVNRNGPEIVNFRPVLGFPAALANRRLRPLGHLTAARQLSINVIAIYAPSGCPFDCPELSLPALKVGAEGNAPRARSADSNAAVLFADNCAGN